MKGSRALVLAWLCACAHGASPTPAPSPTPNALPRASELVDASPVTSAAVPSSDAGAPSASAEQEPSPAPTCAPLAASFLAPVTFNTGVVSTPVPKIEGEPQSLRALHEKLARIARGTGPSGEKARIAFYGDSNMTRDFISGAFRRAVQGRFGDAGHGFVAAARPWGWYEHMDVRHDVSPKDSWGVFAISGRRIGDAAYGSVNIAAETTQGGASTWVATAFGGSPPVGKTASSADVYFLKRPLGGTFSVVVDGAKVTDVSTDSETKDVGVAHVSFADGPHKVESIVKGGRPVRIFGTALERDAGGVIVDSLGAGALNFELLAHVDKRSRVAMLRARPYDLVVFLLGTNLLGAASQKKWVVDVLQDFREALPDAALLVMSAPDQALPSSTTSNPGAETLAKSLRETALSEHALFWDFYAGMGGKGSIRTFMRTGLGEPDGIHLGLAGAMLMGTRFASEVTRGFAAYATEHPDAGCHPR